MILKFIWLECAVLGLGALGVLGAGCSATPHDCYETRSCPEPVAGATGSNHEGGSGGTAGPRERGRGIAGGAREGGVPSAGSSLAEAGATTVVDAPNIVSVSPSDGALGVTRDARIVIEFSQPMDTAATEAAYQSTDLPASALGFSWSEDSTTLTLSPRTALAYAASDGVPARAYRYGFNADAVDQFGQALPPVQLTFSTLRRGALDVRADGERTGNWTVGEEEGIHNCMRKPKAQYQPTVCVGDDVNNVRYSGFLSFDLGGLPENIAQFSSAHLQADAVVHGTPGELGPSRLEHVTYDQLDEAALSVAPLSEPSPLFVAATLIDEAQLTLDLDVTAAVADDYENRVARAARSQHRLSFPRLLANAHWDDVELETSRIHLTLSYLVP